MKFNGKIGFYEGTTETVPSVYKPVIKELPYKGDILNNVRKFQETQNQNDTLTISNRISILSDLYCIKHWMSIRYVLWNGIKWKVISVDVSYPRVILTLGGIYNDKS